jgi:hypothetical protein
MDVFILKYDVDGNDGCASEILGVFGSFEKAKNAFTFYLDEIEKSWREEDQGAITGENTFNRFSEAVEMVLVNATCLRNGEGHMVNVTRFVLE